MRKALAALAALALCAVPFAAAKPDLARTASDAINVQILAINDFHGNLEPVPGREPAPPTGGSEYLSTHINLLRETNPNTVVVSAGDLIGASPLLSALFHDEPTIESMNLIGLDYNAVGNHEFDEGVEELGRMQEGGCHPTDGCIDGDPFLGASFRFLAANVTKKQGGNEIFPPYKIKSFGGHRVAFIGMTLEGTPEIVTPAGVAGVDFHDEADTVNRLVPELKKKGIESIVVLLHEGGTAAGGANGCVGVSGPIIDIVDRTSDDVDLWVTGHTHRAYNCVLDGDLVTSAGSFGGFITDIEFTIDPATGDMQTVSAFNKVVSNDVAKDPAQTELLNKYRAIVTPLANRVIGRISADITRNADEAKESALGDVIADAQLDATDDPGFGDAVVAFMNPGGIRANLTYASSTAGEGDGNVTYGEAFTVQPFGNSLVTLTLTGSQIERILEQQWCGSNAAASKILQVSQGFTYTYDTTGFTTDTNGNWVQPPSPDCDRVDPASVKLNGVTLGAGTSYRVTVNSFLATGGDGFTVINEGTDRLGGDVDLDAFEKYLVADADGVDPGPQDRITIVP